MAAFSTRAGSRHCTCSSARAWLVAMEKDTGHPLGILPRGNLFMAGGGDVRSAGLGDLAALTDELLLDILATFPARTLAVASTVSTAFYCFCAHPDLWRTLALEVSTLETLRRTSGNSAAPYVLLPQTEPTCATSLHEHQICRTTHIAAASLSQEFGGDFRFSGNWRQTYVRRCSPREWTSSVRLSKPVCSDLLYQPWLCATTPLRREWLSRDNIPRIAADDLSRDVFREQFEQRNVPVIITGLARTLGPRLSPDMS